MDRIFNQSYIQNLCEELKNSMRELKAQMNVMEGVADNAISAMNQVPSDVMDSSIESEANALKSRIEDIDIDTFQRKIKNCEVRATKLISTADTQYHEQIEELMGIIDNIREAVAEVREFLKNTPLTMSNNDFATAYEAMHTKCNRYIENADAQMDKILGNIKGAEKISAVFSKDPVNLSTGNFIYDHTDLEVKGVVPFRFRRFYNAINHRKGALGRDWNHNYEVRIVTEEKELVFIREDGKEERFIKSSTGEYVSVYHNNGSLSETEEGYTYETREQAKYYFDKDGYCLRQDNAEGTSIILYYEDVCEPVSDCKTGMIPKTKSLIKIERNTGEAFYLRYNGSGYLASVTDHTGRQITYGMEGELLTGVTTPEGHWMHYEYTPDGKLKGVTNPRGIRTVENEFDSKMRTTLQKFPDGSQMSYAYDDEKREVELTERNGSKVTYVHDKQYRDIRHIYSDGEERFEYNKLNQKTLVVDKLGNKTQFGYDSKGNLTRIINALGVKTEIQYNEFNKPVRVAVNGVEKIRNRYDEEGKLVESKDALGNVRCLEYETKSRPNKLIQPDGSELEVFYDIRGNISKLVDSNGIVNSFIYDALNRVTEATDGNGNTTRYKYDANNNIVKVTNAEGRERTYEYNESNKITKIVDFDGSIVYREYNVLNKPSKVVDQLGRETLLTYDAMWNLARVVQPDGSRTTYLYDEHNRLGRIRNANGDVVRYTYDAAGNRTGIEDEEGNKTKFTYDALGRLTEVTEADGSKIHYVYDAEGNVTEVVDAAGGRVKMEYNEAGLLVRETNQAGESRSYTYTCLGKTASVIDEAGLVINYVYRPGGQLMEILYPDGNRESFMYDANGNITEHTDKRGYRLTYSYDSLNRLISICDSEGTGRQYVYDCVGNITEMTDALGNRTVYEYSLTGQLIRVTDANGNQTEYQYDEKDQLLEIRQYGEAGKEGTEKECQITRYERSPLGQIIKVIDSLGQSENFAYNRKGQLIEKLDKEGYLTRYGYTVQGDVNHIQYADGREVRLSYTSLRQLQEIEDWLGITKVETDAVGRATRITGADGKEISYTYDGAGRRTAIIYPDSTRAEYRYDEMGRLAALIQDDKAITYGYDEKGSLNKKVFPNGMETTYGYTVKGQIESLIHYDAEGILDRYTYGYDIIGNKTSIEKRRRGLEEESGLYTYTYDAIGRLGGVAKDGNTLRTYTYDAFGNRASITQIDGITRYSYNALNQLISKTDAQNEMTYGYDKRGNLTRVQENGYTKNEYLYGAINRLEEAWNAKGEVSRYIYNGLGHRVGRETGQSQPDITKDASWDSLDPVKKIESAVFSPTGRIDYVVDLTREYHNLLQKCESGHTQTYLWDGNVAGMLEEGNTDGSYYLQDEMGSPIRLVNETGIVREDYGYDEFGQDLYGNQGKIQPFGYTGYRYDAISGTYFAQAREYRVGEGRFGGEDVIKGNIDMPFTLNHYGYCWGNPIMLVDLDGEWPSWNDIGNGIKNAVSKVVDTAVDVVRSIDWNEVGKVVAIVGGVATTVAVASLTSGIVGALAVGATIGGELELINQVFEIDEKGQNVWDYSNYNVAKIGVSAIGGAAISGVTMGAGTIGKIVGELTHSAMISFATEITMVVGGSAVVNGITVGVMEKIDNPNISNNELKNKVLEGASWGGIGAIVGYAVGYIVNNSKWYQKILKKWFDARSNATIVFGFNWNDTLYEKHMANLAKMIMYSKNLRVIDAMTNLFTQFGLNQINDECFSD